VLKKIFINFFIWIEKIFPAKYIEISKDHFFLKTPIFIIKKLTISTEGYLKHFTPQKGDVVFDIGAFDGGFTFVASRLVGKNGKVYAFEPQKDVYEILTKKLKNYNLTNIILVNKGLSDSARTILVPLQKSNAGFKTIEMVLRSNNNQLISIDLESLDNFMLSNKIPKIDYLKMDIEGAEIEALEGAVNTLNQFNPNIVIASYHIVNGVQTKVFVESFLRSNGYNAWTSHPAHLTTYGKK